MKLIATSSSPLSLFQNTVTVISAHASHVAAVAFNASGTSLASASEKVSLRKLCSQNLVEELHYLYYVLISFCDSQGTVIRVFSVPDGVKLFEFRRGMKR